MRELADPERVVQAGLHRHRMLDRGDPARVIYSFSFYERGPGVNWLRVQTDNYDQPFNMAEGMRLDLGSTAKLRTLVHYLQIMAELHERLAGLDARGVEQFEVPYPDRLSRWARERLSNNPDLGLSEFLEAALQRRYSASPSRRFYTGGGMHRFSNFSPDDDEKLLTVLEAFHRSVNLVFVRLMRDIVRYCERSVVDSTVGLLENLDHPLRKAYLRRFAEREGGLLVNRFYRQHSGHAVGESLEILLRRAGSSPKRLATVLRAVAPGIALENFSARMRDLLPHTQLTNPALAKLYRNQGVERLGWSDRAYITRIHSLELWVVAYLHRQPKATLNELLRASRDVRIAVYRWLFRTRHKRAQDRRIQTLLEIEAFMAIQQAWQNLGYPFESLVPSYATALGSSGDRPAALAELMGIILNEGVRYPTRRFERLKFAEQTPYETVLSPLLAEGQRVLAPQVAMAVRRALIGTVQKGTARRIQDAFLDRDGRSLIVGGKTGTGDHRHRTYGPGGRLLKERVVNRSATFMFFIDDRFYGVMTAHVPGPDAAVYHFTSTLAVQLLRLFAPVLQPLIQQPPATLRVAQGQDETLVLPGIAQSLSVSQ